jgi:excisionase family DNA binding protein
MIMSENLMSQLIEFIKEPIKGLIREVIREEKVILQPVPVELNPGAANHTPLSRRELKDKYHISLVTIYNLMKDGKLPFHRFGQRKLVFYEDEVEAAFPKILKRGGK